jgi:hypothetical protein
MPVVYYTVKVSNDQKRLALDFEGDDLIDPTSEPFKTAIEKTLNEFNSPVETVKISLNVEV